jgi:hypothetical protein
MLFFLRNKDIECSTAVPRGKETNKGKKLGKANLCQPLFDAILFSEMKIHFCFINGTFLIFKQISEAKKVHILKQVSVSSFASLDFFCKQEIMLCQENVMDF